MLATQQMKVNAGLCDAVGYLTCDFVVKLRNIRILKKE